MLYYYWSRRGIRPSEIYNMPPGEQLLIRAFYEYEREERGRHEKGGAWPMLPVM